MPTDAFVIRAAAKAYSAAINPNESLNVSRVMSHSERVTYLGVEDLRIGQIAQSGTQNGPIPEGSPIIQVYAVDDAVESLPISEDPILMSLHFTTPKKQVFAADGPSIQDIADENFGDEEEAGEVPTIGAG